MNDTQQAFHARILHLCHAVIDANTLTDLTSLKDAAKGIEREIVSVPLEFAKDDCRDLI